MKTVLLTSDKFTGEIELVYDFSEMLVRYDATRAELSEKQKLYFLHNLPRDVAALVNFKEKLPNVKQTEIEFEVTFEQFWKAYFRDRLKDNSSKKRAELKWNKMTKRDQVKAFNYIPAYMSKIKPGTEPKYAETYLNAEVWN